MVIKYITLYYDPNEKSVFYTKFVKGFQSILTGFKFFNDYWYQVTGDPITKLDKKGKDTLLKLLNDNLFESVIVVNRLGVIIK